VNDGGVSGVAQDGVIEFAPGATPRVVETDKATSLPLQLGMFVLSAVYGFIPELPERSQWRVEFSLHPIRRGWKQAHTIIWEAEELEGRDLCVTPKWPNSFSEFIGDKVFGLLLAENLGFRVPRSTVLCRTVSPFSFGQPTKSDVKWLRTCPRIPEPGYFPTVRGWTDPFKLMKNDVDERLAALMIQDEVQARYSGALLTGSDGLPIIEGVAGYGDEFMLGRSHPAQLPEDLTLTLQRLHRAGADQYGAIRMEWVFDGGDVWVVQLQQEAALSRGSIIVPGEVDSWVEFDIVQGLDALRALVSRARITPLGITLTGRVGLTSHMADVLRRANVPSRINA
jgi:hypothetical protein